MKFSQFKLLVDMMFTPDEQGGIKTRYDGTNVRQMNPLVLAYVGDAFFHLFVRTRLLSAVWQHKAYLGIESMLTDEEKAIYRRGRNAKSHAPRSSSVAEYHSSTGFEALLGTLYLSEKFERLQELCEAAFAVISKAMMEEIHGKTTEGTEKQ